MTYQYFFRIAFFFLFYLFTLSARAQITLNFSLPQRAELIANAGKDTTIEKGEQIKLGGDVTATGGSGNYTYLWSPATGLSDPKIAQPVATADSTITYTLTVSDQFCTSTSAITLRVDKVTGLEPFAASAGLKLFPNPNDGTFMITSEYSLGEPSISLQIFNSLGQVVYSKPLNGLTKLSESIILTDQSKGLFVIMLSANNRKVIYKIFIQ